MKVTKCNNDFASPTGEDLKEINQKKFDKKIARAVKVDREVERLSLALSKLKMKGAVLESAGVNLKKRTGSTKKKKKQFVYVKGKPYVVNGGVESHLSGVPTKVWMQSIIGSDPYPSTDPHKCPDTADRLINNFDIDSGLYDHIEGIMLLCVSLYDSKSYLGMMSAFLTYCKHYHIKKSLVTSLHGLLTETYSKYSVQNGFVDTVCNFIDNWTDLVKLPMFNYVGRIIAICVSLGLCSASSLKFGFEGLNLFATEALKKQATAVDLFDAVLSTVRYFLTAGAEAFKTGSLRPFMFSNQRVAAIDSLYYEVRVAMNLYSSGNLSAASIKTEPDLSAALMRLIDELLQIKAIERDSVMKRIIEQRLTQAYEWRGEFVARSAGGQLRVAPYTFLIWGKSGYGKSAIAVNLIQAILCANGFDHLDPARVVTINPADKFISNAKADTLAYIFDDMGAECPKYQDTNHARRWLDMSNNIAGYANMADIMDKGMCTFNHKVQVGTANHRDGGMDQFSTYKIAVARRGTRDHVTLLPAFANSEGSVDSAKVAAIFPPQPNQVVVPDIYRFTVEKATEDPQNAGNYIYNVVKWDNNGVLVPMQDVDYKTYIAYHVHQSQMHFAFQSNWVQSTKQGPNALCVCKKCNKINMLCGCPYSSQFGFEEVVQAISRQIIARYANQVIDFGTHCISMLRTRNLVALLPDCVYNNPVFRGYVNWHIHNVTSSYVWKSLFCVWLLFFILSSWRGGWSYYVWCSLLFFSLGAKLVVDQVVSQVFFSLMEHERHAMHQRILVLQRRFMSCVAYSAGILALLKIYHMYKSTPNFKLQGNLSPQGVDDICNRDKEQNMWAKVVVTPMEVSEKSKRSCFDHLQNVVRKNQLYVSCEDSGRRPFSNAFMVKTGYCIIPHHMLFDDAREYIFQRDDIGVLGTSFKAVLSLRDSILIPGTDLALVFVPSCGDFKDLSDYLALTPTRTGWASLVYKKKDGTFNDSTSFRVAVGKIQCDGMASPTISGLEYILPYDSYCGLCCGTLITNGKAPVIAGFHSVGVVGERRGGSSIITRDLFDSALLTLSGRFSSIAPLSSQGNITEVQHGIEYVEGHDVHIHSPCRFIDYDLVTSCGVFGSVIGRNRMVSAIRPTTIADRVREVFQQPLAYGPPKFHLGRHWRDHLLKCFVPSRGCSQSLLEIAMKDYLLMVPKLMSLDFVREQVTPLSNNAIVNGIDGVRFIDRMKVTSSMGFPINKSKIHFLTMVDGPNAVNFDFPEDIWNIVKECEHTYLRGKRFYPIFRACAKDEVKPLNSTKVRIFEAAPIVLQILIRKFFLPVARVLSLYSLDSECAVGINAVSDEWHQLMDHVCRFGRGQMIAGDYSGFDTRMPAQFTIAAFNVCIELARTSGNYNESDITIMQGMISDIVHPLVAFNGDLVMLFGTNPSGQNMTVYINSIVNSLYIRCAFFSIYPGRVFRDHVGLATYGDDFIGSVSKLCPDFNFRSIKEFLATMDIKLTLPNKTESDIEYLDFKDVDFLKRKSFLNPDLGHEVGLLEEESILKSLVCQEISKVVTPNEQLAGAIASALNEYFYYGREVYEDRRRKLKEILAGFPLRVAEIDEPYESRLQRIKDENYSL